MRFSKEEKLRIAGGIAWVAAIFALIMSTLLIVNYVQLTRVDPLETPALQTLVDQLKNDPSNESLKEDIRALDLLMRKAYFTSQWQLQTGGLMLLFAVLILVISVRYRKSLISDLEELESIEKSAQLDKEKARKWVIYSGGGFFVLALLSGLLSNNYLKNYGTELPVVVQETGNSELVTAQYASAATEQAVAEVEQSTNETIAESTVLSAAQTTIQTVQTGTGVSATQQQTATQTQPTTSASNIPTTAQIKSNYPYFRGPEGIGVAYKNSVPTSFNIASGQNVLWKTAIPLHGYNSPVIWGNKVFLSGASDAERVVYCYNVTDGELLWQAKADNIQGSPASKTEATEDTGLAAPSLATNGSAVFAIFANGDVIALDMDGKRLWARNIGKPSNYYGHSSSLILYKDNLIIQYDTNSGAKVMSLSINNGTTKWEKARNVRISWSSPVVVNTGSRDELILVADPAVIGYDPATGTELWNIDCIAGEVGASVGYADGIVYAANEYATFSAIKLGTTPEIIWEQQELLPEASSPLAYNGLVLVVTSYGVGACYDALTGEKYWEAEFNDAIYGSPVLAGGNVYLMTNSGKLWVFKLAKTYQKVAESDLGEYSSCTPAFIEGKMFLRGFDNLYCIGN